MASYQLPSDVYTNPYEWRCFVVLITVTLSFQEAVGEMSEKLLSKEVRLREEALQKFIQLEKLVQREESNRNNFEKQLREDNDVK